METIEERWLTFRTNAIASNASAVQVREMRIAFYAGFMSMLRATAELTCMEDETAILELECLWVEARSFGYSL